MLASIRLRRRVVAGAVAGATAACGFGGVALAQPTRNVQLNEVLFNPPGSPDQGQEFIELRSEPGTSLTGLTVITIEGEFAAAPGGAGVIDFVLNLDDFSTGTNGLFLWRDAAVGLTPLPEAATNVLVRDVIPGEADLENGTMTMLLVEGFTGTLGQDLDPENDGILNSTPWTRVLDSFGFYNDAEACGWQQGARISWIYSSLDVSDYTTGPCPAPGFTPDTFMRLCDLAFVTDLLGPTNGPWARDAAEVLSFPTAGWTLGDDFLATPGSANIQACVPPVGPTCDTLDFNQDGDFPTPLDLEDFIAANAGNICSTCSTDLDFNNDGDFPTPLDIEAFISVNAGGPCL